MSRAHRGERDKGFGFIAGASGELFFHQSALQDVRFEELREGQTVEYDEGQGPKGSLQLVVSQRADGRHQDRTAQAVYSSLAPDVVSVNQTGRLTARGDGRGTIRVTLDQQIVDVAFDVVDIGADVPPDFETDIQPILAARGCSTGACHGKQGGKNGFQLSLLGFDSDFDHASLTQQSRGRRLSLAAARQSLLLRKATAEVPHGGGRRFTAQEPHYYSLLSWIRGGAQRQSARFIRYSEIRLLITPLPVIVPFFFALNAVASSLKCWTMVPGSGPSKMTFALPS